MRATVLVVAALLVVGAAAPLAAASAAGGSAAAADVAVQDGDANNETDNETAPGARLAGVVGVQAAEVEGEVERRAFGHQIRAANSNASKASVVANHTERLDQRLEDLRDRKQELEANRGNVSTGRYHAEMARLAAEIATLQRLTNETAETARGLPAETLEANGVNVTALDRLRTSASNLSGPEVAAIARSIAGPPGNGSAGPPFGIGAGGPSEGPFGERDDGNETDDETDADTPGNGPDAPGEVGSDDGNETVAGEDDAPGNSPGASGNGPGANTSENETSDEPGPPDDAGPFGHLSALASLLH
ncbi:hypothetical protein [Halobacterium hubeiense]|uniref:hypothetical protein n=1 Tax=Halobacterium hubeiense TaxID=1407499 RepID=UPI003C71564D